MESFNVRTTLTQKDWQALLAAAGVRLAGLKAKKANLITRAAPTFSWLVLVAVFVLMLSTTPPLMSVLGLCGAVVAFFSFWWFQYFLQRRTYAPSERGVFLGESRFEFEAGGFHARRENSDAFNRWSLVTDVTCTDEHLFLWIDAFSAYVVPARDLPAPMNAHEAARRIREFMASAAATDGAQVLRMAAPTETSAPTSLAPATPAGVPSVGQELLALLRLQSWGLVDPARLSGRDLTIFLLGVLSFVLWAGLDRLDYDGNVEILLYTLPGNGVLLLAVLLAGWVMSRLSRPLLEMRQALLLVLGFLPLFVLVVWFAGKLPRIGAIVLGVLLMAWAQRYLTAGMRSLTGKPQALAVTSVLIGTVLLFYLSTRFYFSPGIWYEPEPDGEMSAAMQRDNEQLVFEQSARLTAAIEQMPPRVETEANAFFVGFAGYGDQRVFAEEIKLASKRLGERYPVGGRSLLLINDRRDNEKYPIATAPALRFALNALGKRMNVEEDVLFLSLSSHGSEDATISVSSELGYWRDLGANDLADMLRESGIRWKVIVISACHAGSFIEALQDENTIVLTAAAAERASFGCSDDNDLTYFGEAFYRDALPAAASLREAFDAARAALKDREMAEARTPSDPQSHFGAALEKKLAAMEKVRTAAGGGTPSR